MKQTEAGDGSKIGQGSLVMNSEGDTGTVTEITGAGNGWRNGVEVDYGGETGYCEAHDLKSAQDWMVLLCRRACTPSSRGWS